MSALAERLGLETRTTVRAFREYQENGGKKVPDQLKLLFLAIDTIPVCIVECERGFSQMNLILSPVRNSLSVSTVSSLLFAKLVGPPLTLFNPQKYVQSWLTSGRHSADDTNSKERVTDEINQAVWKLL